jgi:hypothetical protein
MRRSLRVLRTATLLSCLPSAAFAAGPTSSSTPPSISAISYKMSNVAGDLSKRETGEPVQNQEKRIVRDLDLVIAALEKECEKCKGTRASNNPKKPAQDSMIHGGMGGIGDLVDPNESAKDWAKLSARERDRILQSMSEGFPPEYRTVLERYYRRLAEEKTAAPPTGDAAKSNDAAATNKPAVDQAPR